MPVDYGTRPRQARCGSRPLERSHLSARRNRTRAARRVRPHVTQMLERSLQIAATVTDAAYGVVA
jgi:hypothetical protein